MVVEEPRCATAGRSARPCGIGPRRWPSPRVEIPTAILTAKPQPKAGWTLEIEREPLAAPIKGDGGPRPTQPAPTLTVTPGADDGMSGMDMSPH